MSTRAGAVFADAKSYKSGSLDEIVGIGVPKSIWLTAYTRALEQQSPDEAAKTADAALNIYLERWFQILEVPIGMDPTAYLNTIHYASNAG